MYELYSNELKNPCNRVFVFDRHQFNTISDRNPSCVFHLPLCADTTTFSSVIESGVAEFNTAISQNRTPKFSCDVSLIGSLYSEKCPYNKATHLSDYTKGYIDALVEAQQNVYGYNLIYDSLTDSVVEKILGEENIYLFPENSVGDYKAVVADSLVGIKASEQERIRLLKYLSENNINIDLYTGSDTSMLPLVHNRGFAKSLTEMPLIFSRSKINLNITAKTIQTGIPQRVFDVLACGGFLLSNYQEELFEHFVPGEDLDVYSSKEELLDKINFYLSHETERISIARHGYEKCIKQHSVNVRLNQILQSVL